MSVSKENKSRGKIETPNSIHKMDETIIVTFYSTLNFSSSSFEFS